MHRTLAILVLVALLALATGFGVQRLRERATDLAVQDYQAQQLQFARLGADRMAEALGAASAIAAELPSGASAPIGWAAAPLLRDSGARLVLETPAGVSVVGGDPEIPAHGHATPTELGVHDCPQCFDEYAFAVTRAVPGHADARLTVQFPSAPTYARLFKDHSGPFRAYLWVMRRDGTVLLSPDPSATGTRPFAGSEFADTLELIRARDTGTASYRWGEPGGTSSERLVAWTHVANAPDVVVLYSADREGALARTEAFADDARLVVQTLALGLIILALFIGFDTHLRFRRERAARDRLALTEARYRTMVGQAADMLLEVDEANIITRVNLAARRCLGKVVGRPLPAIFLNDDEEALEDAARLLDHSKTVDDLKLRVRCGTDDSIPVSVRATYIKVPGMPGFAQWALRDLSALEREHQRVIQMEKLSTIGRLTAVVSHEIKNPLSAIRTNASYARTVVGDLPDGGQSEMGEVLADIITAVNQIDDIVKAVGGVVRHKPNHRHIDLRDTVKSALTLAGPRLQRSRLEIHLPESLPVMGAAGELSQIVVNVLVNAAQAVSPVADGEIRLTGWTEPLHTVLTVEDNGGGIPEGQLNQLFEPFFTTRATGEGTGLGLAVSRELAERHGGRLLCTSADGRTRFELRLPRAGSLDASPTIAA